MQVKQIIEYKSGNRYFGGFLQTLINESGIKASISQFDNKIELLFGENEEDKLNDFYKLVDKYLPYSIYMGEVTTQETQDEVEGKEFKSEDYNIAPCIKCMELLNDPSSEHYLDASFVCDHYNNPAQSVYEDHTVFSPHYSQGCSVLITDANKINDLFIVTEDEVRVLFSIEKPTIKVTIKDETLKELCGKNYIYIKAPYNNRSALAAINAKESGVDYLFFVGGDDLKGVVVQKNTTIIKASRLVKYLENIHEDSTVNRFLNIAKEAGYNKGAIGANLSTKGINFLVSNEVGVKKVIEFGEFDLASLLNSFQNDPKRSKLIKNFNTKFPEIYDRLESNDNLGLFETIALILELDIKEDSYESVCDKSYEFRGNGGLKIDMHFSEDSFSYDDFIGSLISFKLAGVDMHYLAYSIFEAYGDMAISVMNQLKTKFKIEDFVMMGDMFGNSVLYSRILSKFQLSNPYFSKGFALDN